MAKKSIDPGGRLIQRHQFPCIGAGWQALFASRMIPGPRVDSGSRLWRSLSAAALCIMLAAILASCADHNDDSDAEIQEPDRVESTANREDVHETVTRGMSPPSAGRASVDGQANLHEEGVQGLESVANSNPPEKPDKDQSPKDEYPFLSDGNVSEVTAELAGQFGGKVQFLEHPQRGTASVLILPRRFVAGETPLIVSLHGFGGNSADHARHVPLHERVNADGFALLLPNGQSDREGNRFWNPTDRCCDGGKSGEDDFAFLTQVVASARAVKEFGPVHFFGYSNGGFMAHHMACKGLPGLRAIVSVAGTSYVDDASCEGAPPVSVLHVHGTADDVIRFAGDESERGQPGEEERAFYAGAREMVERWSRLAACPWPADAQPSASLDLDQFVPGVETQVFRLDPACGQGVSIELWVAEGSGHAFAFGDAFLDALIEWLLAQV